MTSFVIEREKLEANTNEIFERADGKTVIAIREKINAMIKAKV